MTQSHNQMVARIAALEAELAGVKKFQPKEGAQCWTLGMVTLPSFAGSWIQLLDPAQKLAANLHWCRAGEERSVDLEDQAAFILAAINGTFKSDDKSYRFQSDVDKWVMDCFGLQVARDKPTRNHRFLEEALELAQAGDCTREEALQLVQYVFDRPKGELRNEIGGVMVTLHALACAYDMSVQGCADQELRRISTPEMTKKIAEKSKNKPKFSALPQKQKLPAKEYNSTLHALEKWAMTEKNDKARSYAYDLIERLKNEWEPVEDRPICSADGCSEREPCGSYCRDNGNFDRKPVKVIRREENEDIIKAVFNNIHRNGSLADLLDKRYGLHRNS